MSHRITISVEELELSAELNDSPTAKKILEALPIEGDGNVWGEEIYFSIPVTAKMEADAREEVDVGTLAYWPSGSAFCIFFGPTPVSTGERPRAYSPVNIVGRVLDDATLLRALADGTPVKITRND